MLVYFIIVHNKKKYVYFHNTRSGKFTRNKVEIAQSDFDKAKAFHLTEWSNRSKK